MPSEDFDFFVIGAGSGGVRAARMAAQRGVRVAVAEAAALGGTCVNVGCIPKKLYSYAAAYGEAFEEAEGYGWTVAKPSFDWGHLKAARAREITRLNGVYRQLLTGSGATLLTGWAQIVDAHTVEVQEAGGPKRYSARHILVATGGTPLVPAVSGREHVVTSDHMFDLEPFPKRLVIVGGGYIACEFASIFNGLGSQVVQVHRGPGVLGGFDHDIAAFVGREMSRVGIDQQLNANVAAITPAAGGLQVTLTSGAQFAADQVLYATGRIPNVQGLGLEALGVAQADNGAIRVDAHYRTSVPSIHAIGDVSTSKQLTPVALGEGMALVDHLFGPAPGARARTMSYDYIPTAVFTHPNIGTVGFSEVQAREEFGQVTVFRSEFKALRHTLSGSGERTLMKLLVDTASDRVVGLHMVGPDAGEIVQGFAVAMKSGATKADFDHTIGIHPTVAEEFVTMREPVKE